ncbi:hypothetical protein G6F50_018080 [Rhizopus delemar]|uniref:Uncharacterized protein n=1 Tax=Rhizopus delemar TaxID=936053 RepID=A0A9P6XN89_9FUNG|nr:hypothetical protein G6F50_018080 [Rhizopus delemar]
MRGDLCDLHLAGLEHGLQPVSIHAHGAGRTERSRPDLPAVGLAEVLAAGTALCHARAAVEHDDVHVGRLVLPGGRRSHLGGRARHQAARHRLLHRRRDPGRGWPRHRLGHRRHDGGHPAV